MYTERMCSYKSARPEIKPVFTTPKSHIPTFEDVMSFLKRPVKMD